MAKGKKETSEVKKVKYFTTCSIRENGKVIEPFVEYKGNYEKELLANGSIEAK